MQCEPCLAEVMSYASPTTGEPVGLSFIEPKSLGDLERRRHMVKRWNDYCLGMFPRSPDFLNVTLAAFASGAKCFGPYANNVRGARRGSGHDPFPDQSPGGPVKERG